MARNFAALNIDLEKKLTEVQELSAKSIEKERKKTDEKRRKEMRNTEYIMNLVEYKNKKTLPP